MKVKIVTVKAAMAFDKMVTLTYELSCSKHKYTVSKKGNVSYPFSNKFLIG